jgi:hypothetical protein
VKMIHTALTEIMDFSGLNISVSKYLNIIYEYSVSNIYHIFVV